MYRITEPHSGYKILKQMTNLSNLKDYFVISENTDGIIDKVDFNKNKIWEICGNY